MLSIANLKLTKSPGARTLGIRHPQSYEFPSLRKIQQSEEMAKIEIENIFTQDKYQLSGLRSF